MAGKDKRLELLTAHHPSTRWVGPPARPGSTHGALHSTGHMSQTPPLQSRLQESVRRVSFPANAAARSDPSGQDTTGRRIPPDSAAPSALSSPAKCYRSAAAALRFGAYGAFVLSPDNPRADVRAIRNMFFRLIAQPGPQPVERGSILPSKRRLTHTALPRVCAGSDAAASLTSARGRSRGSPSTARTAPSALAPMRAPATRSRSATTPQCAPGVIEGSGANARGCRTVARSFALLRTSTVESKVRAPPPSPP